RSRDPLKNTAVRLLQRRYADDAPGSALRLPTAVPLPTDVRRFIESARWTFAKTYAATWPHEYIVLTPENTPMILALAWHIFQHGKFGLGGSKGLAARLSPFCYTWRRRCQKNLATEALAFTTGRRSDRRVENRSF